MSGAMLGMNAGVIAVLIIGVTGSEGVMMAWAFCPQRGLVNKRQIKIMEKGIICILTLQTMEVFLVFAAQLYPEDRSLFVAMGVVSALMGIVSVMTAKMVITEEEGRVIEIENSDVRIETNKSRATIKKMIARQELDNKRSIIQVENRVRDQEKRQVIEAIQTRENQAAIRNIGVARAAAVIAAYQSRIESYSDEIIGKPVKAKLTSGTPQPSFR